MEKKDTGSHVADGCASELEQAVSYIKDGILELDNENTEKAMAK